MNHTGSDTRPPDTRDDWCDQQDRVSEGGRIYRCSKCRKRLYPREIFQDGESKGWQLPPHKEKGHKIRALKMKRQKMRAGQKRDRLKSKGQRSNDKTRPK